MTRESYVPGAGESGGSKDRSGRKNGENADSRLPQFRNFYAGHKNGKQFVAAVTQD